MWSPLLRMLDDPSILDQLKRLADFIDLHPCVFKSGTPMLNLTASPGSAHAYYPDLPLLHHGDENEMNSYSLH